MAESEKEIKEAIETLEEISSDEAKERIAELRQKYIMDKQAELDAAEEKGIRKGVKRGKEEIAKKMIQKNISIDEIIELTGLSKEEIDEIS